MGQPSRPYEFSLSERSGPSTLNNNTGNDDLEQKLPRASSKHSGDVNQLDLAHDEIMAEEILSVKDRIDFNIEDIKTSIQSTSHYLKALIRESLSQQRLDTLRSNFAQGQKIREAKLTHINFRQIEEQLGSMKAQLGNYMHELQHSNYIRQNTTKQEHSGHIIKLNKLAGKYEKACQRLERLKQLR